MTAPLMAYVYDGRACLGFILARGKLGFESFDPNGKSLGVFATQEQAATAISGSIKQGCDE
jgi:hypothetical protein